MTTLMEPPAGDHIDSSSDAHKQPQDGHSCPSPGSLLVRASFDQCRRSLTPPGESHSSPMTLTKVLFHFVDNCGVIRLRLLPRRILRALIIVGGTNALFRDGQECPSYGLLCACTKNRRLAPCRSQFPRQFNSADGDWFFPWPPGYENCLTGVTACRVGRA